MEASDLLLCLSLSKHVGLCYVVDVAAGHMNSRIVLSLPGTVKDSDLQAPSRDLVHSIEASSVLWMRHIKTALCHTLDEIAGHGQAMPQFPLLAEIDYWRDRAAQLSQIKEQLSHCNVQKVVSALNVAASTYLPAFVRLAKEVEVALHEAEENAKYLQPMYHQCTALCTTGDFKQLNRLFKPLLHSMLLIWQHSHHYSTASQFVRLVRHICDTLVLRASVYAGGHFLAFQSFGLPT